VNQAASEAVTRLQRASGWRKKELQTLQSAMPVIGVSSRFNMMRGSLVLLCAHCEGFLRDATAIFLRYLEDRSPALADIRESYIILLKPDGLPRPWQAARNELLGDTSGRRRMLGDLRRHVWLLGLDYPPFEAQEKPLGELVRLRNAIAHGEKQWLSDDNYSEHTRRVLTFIDTLEDEVIGSVRNERYLRSAA